MLVSVTRVRLRSVQFLPGFARHAFASMLQARRSQGCRAANALADRRLTFWTMTCWDDAASMANFRGASAHKVAMRYLPAWCDEASYVRWTVSGDTRPDWITAYERMMSDGIATPVIHASADQSARRWPRPRLTFAI